MAERLTLVIHALHGGGAERTAARMASEWARRGYNVHLVTLDSAEHDVFPVTSEVQRVALELMRDSRSVWQALANNRQRIRRLREAIWTARPDCVVSFTEQMNVLTLLACRRLRVDGRRLPVVVCERTDPRLHAAGRVWDLLRRRLYRHSAGIVTQTSPIRDFVASFAKAVPVYVVPNCVWPDSLVKDPPPLLQRPQRVVAVGRLAKEKGFDLSIEAFRRVAAANPRWRLAILGEGGQRKALQQQIAAGGLEDRVELLGWRDDPVPDLLASQVFAMSSEYEGFPNALLEAMACGLAPVSFDCESGPREIIRHETDGLLVPVGDVQALAEGLRRLIESPEDRSRFAARALEVRQRFSMDQFFWAWRDILQAAISSPANE